RERLGPGTSASSATLPAPSPESEPGLIARLPSLRSPGPAATHPSGSLTASAGCSGRSTADLHETHQVAVVAPGQHVLGGLLLEDAEDLGLEGPGGVCAQEMAEGVDAVGEEAEAELASRGEAEAVAVGAEGVRQGCDEAHGSLVDGEMVGGGGAAAGAGVVWIERD